jgi:hypothetical protein
MSQRVTVCGEVKGVTPGAEAKASLNRALLFEVVVAGSRPETGLPTHGQGEAKVKLRGGPNRLRLQTERMNCG